jgi:hypothetical protein
VGAAHDFEQLHDVHGIEEVQAEDGLGAPRRRGDVGDGEARGVGAEERTWGQDLVGPREEVAL